MSMYAIEEKPKQCPRCGNDSSKVNQKYTVKYPAPITRRKRICNNCAKVYFTETPYDRRFI